MSFKAKVKGPGDMIRSEDWNEAMNEIARLSVNSLETEKRLESLNSNQTRTENYIIHSGGIIMWSGTNVPKGWSLCDGSNGTPDLRGRFIVGLDSGSKDYKKVGNIGGESSHKLTMKEMPKHNHGMNGALNVYDKSPWHSAKDHKATPVVGNNVVNWDEGSSSPHENRPPYYTLAFIMKMPE